MDYERLEIGKALIEGTLGGAKADPALRALIRAIANCGPWLRASTWPESVVLALADLDSECERAASVRRNCDHQTALAERRHAEARDATEALHAANARVAELESELADSMDATARAMEAAKRDAAWLAAIVGELGGLTLSQLPPGAYGGSLASLYCDYKAGRDAPG